MELYSTRLFKHLAQRPALKSLQICLRSPKSDSELLLFLEQADAPIFSDLQSLKISDLRDSRLCTALFPHLTSLRFLDIGCSLHLSPDDFSLSPKYNAYDWFFAQLPTSPELDHLRVDFQIKCEPRPTSWYLKLLGSALVHLAEKYSNLRILRLSISMEGIDGTAIADADIDRLAFLLTKLNSLSIGLQPFLQNLTIRCVESLAKHCHSFEECEIPGNFDITSLKMEQACLFPTLRYIAIHLKDQGSFSDLEIQQLKAVFDHHFPQLRSLTGFRDCKIWPLPMVSSHPPWTEAKLRSFINDGAEENSSSDRDYEYSDDLSIGDLDQSDLDMTDAEETDQAFTDFEDSEPEEPDPDNIDPDEDNEP